MIPKDLFQKVRRIQITTNRLVTDVFAGQYHSVFKGLGMEFDEVREYQVGDDIRFIDWNVTARTGRAHIKKFIEERELTVMLLVDASASSFFATKNKMKNKLAAEIAALLAFAAIRNNDKVGLIIYTNTIEKFIPPRKGVQNVLRVIREVLYFQPKNKGTDIPYALEFLSKVTTRKSVSFLISDFMQTGFFYFHEETQNKKLKKSMAIANKRHDLIAITLNDPKERELPSKGLFNFEDAETGESRLIDCSNQKIRKKYYQQAVHRMNIRDHFFQAIGIDHIDVFTDQPYINEIIKFFHNRQKKKI